jgi:chromatin assembly factor 1 subunit B
MKVKTPQISWHEKEPIYSVHFHKSGRIATSGADNEIKIWKIIGSSDQNLKFEFQSALKRHIKSVNTVKFSPVADFLASGGDGRSLTFLSRPEKITRWYDIHLEVI